MENEHLKNSSSRKNRRCLIFSATIVGVMMLCSFQTKAQENEPQTQVFADRITIVIKQTRKITVDESIRSATAVDESVATVEINADNILTIRAVDFGETMIVVTTESGREIFVIEVVGNPVIAKTEQSAKVSKVKKSSPNVGFYQVNAAFSPEAGGFVAQQKISLRRRIADSKYLKLSSEWTQNIGGGNRSMYLPNQRFQMQTLTVGIETSGASVDLLDSEIAVSPLSFNSFSIRGVHLMSSENSKIRGIEVFAGTTRPLLKFFEPSENRIFGIIVPLKNRPRLKVKTAAYFVRANRQMLNKTDGGEVFQVLTEYLPNKKLSLEGEIQFANRKISWRGNFKGKFDKFEVFAEAEHLAANSPLVGIQAQVAGRKTTSGFVSWQPTSSWNFSGGFNRIVSSQTNGNRRFAPNQSNTFANINYRFSDTWQIGARYNKQKSSFSVPNSALRFDFNTDAYSFFTAGTLPKNWRHRLETSFSRSRESENNIADKKGNAFSYELQRNWKTFSATLFLNTSRNQNSPAGLLLRNPSLLPLPLRELFLADPILFLTTQRDLLEQLFPNFNLQANRQTNLGGRGQISLGKWNFYAEAKFLQNEFNRLSQTGLTVNSSAIWRIDEANTLGLRVGNRLLRNGGNAGNYNYSMDAMFSLTHQFGTSGGFRFSRLFKRNRRKINGKVFYDRNGNGKIDEREEGIAGIKIRLNEGQTLVSNADGDFEFLQLADGEYRVELDVEGFGKLWRVSSDVSRTVDLSAAKSAEINFGLNDYSFAAGRIYNDTNLSGQNDKDAPGIDFVKVKIEPVDEVNIKVIAPQTQTTDGGGQYNFRYLPPGKYRLEIMPESLPDNFVVPGELIWFINVAPIRGVYKDIPLVAQRAIRGTVFIDRDNNGEFEAETDLPIFKAKISAGTQQTESDENGAYFLRNLPAGEIIVRAVLPDGTQTQTVTKTLDSAPTFLGNINLVFSKP
jgi:hypothetical protein